MAQPQSTRQSSYYRQRIVYGIRDTNTTPGIFTDVIDDSIADVYPWPDDESEFSVNGGNAANSESGIGIQRVRVTVLDRQFDQSQHDIVLNGASDVVIPGGPYYRVIELFAKDVGSNAVAAAAPVTVQAANNDTLAIIPVGRNANNVSAYTIPRGMEGGHRMVEWKGFINASKTGDEGALFLTARAPGDTAWHSIDRTPVLSDRDGQVEGGASYTAFPLRLDDGTDIIMKGIAAQDMAFLGGMRFII